MNPKEQVFLNSCELVLQQFSIKQKGFIYFVWRKGKKHIQSLKYQCSQDTVPMKQTLTLSLKTYSINGVMQKKYTNLSLFDGQGRQLDHLKFQVTEWRPEGMQRRITLGTCNLKVKVKRKVALELQNFHRHSKTQIQESSQQQENNETGQVGKIQKKQQLNIKQQLAKAKRQIEDFDYMTNKLKNDRNFYITQNENLRQKLSQIHEDYGDQISKLKNHYQTRIQIRESIYEQQIQQSISTFNSNYQINRSLVESLIHEKYDYEAEIAEMKEIHQDYIEKQEHNYEGMIADLQQNKRQIEEQIKDNLNKISDRQNTITQLKKQLEETTILFNETKNQLNKQIQQHTKHNEEWQRALQEKQTQIYKHLDEIQALKIQIDTKDFQIKENQAAMQHYRAVISEYEEDKIQSQKVNHQLETEKYNLAVDIQRLKVTIEEQINSLQFHKASIEQLKEQDKIKQEQYAAQYRSLQSIYNQKQQMFTNEMKAQHEKFLDVNKQNYDLQLKVQQTQHDNAILNDQIGILKNDNEQTILLNDQLRQQIKQQSEAFHKQYRQYNQQIADLMSQNNVFQAQNNTLKDQIRQLQTKLQLQTENLKKDYEDLVESKTRLYEDQLDFTKKQRDADFQNFDKLKQQYQNQIATLIQRENKQNEDMQRMFRDQMDLKNKQYLELNQNHKLMQEAYDDLKLRIQILEQQKNNLLANKGKRGRNVGQEQMDIEQIQQQSQEDSQQQSQSQEESQQSSGKKKKKKKGKNKDKDKKKKKKKQDKKSKNKKGKKKKVSSSEESQQSSEKSQVSQQNDQSQMLANIMDDEQIQPKNLVKANQNNAGSQKMIPYDQNKDDPATSSNKKGNPDPISIPIPDEHQMRKSSNRSEKSYSSKKRKRQDSSLQNSKGKLKGGVKQLQKEIKNLKKQIKEYQRNQAVHLAQIQEQEEQIKSLNLQIDNLIKKISKKDPKLARKISSQLQQKRQQKSVSNKSRSQVSMKMPPIPRKQVQNMKNQNEYLKRNNQQKSRSLVNLQNQKSSLAFKLQNMQTLKAQLEKKLQKYQGKPEQKRQQNKAASSMIQQGLKRSLLQFQGKFMNEKQKAQQIKLQKNQLAFEKEQLQNQNKRLRIKLDDIEDQIKKNQPSQSAKQMQKELQQNNRQFLELSKSLNSAKLQKEAFEEQVRLMKKRYSEIIRASQQAQTKAANLERQVDDLRRKDNKNRRDMQQYTDDIKKYKDQIKQLQGDMNSFNTVQSQSVYQRKKVMDEISKLQDALSTKQFQIIKLNKELQKFKQKIQQGDEIKIGKRNDLLAQRQRLEGLLIKAQKRVQQLQEQDKLLRQRIDILERQNKKNLEQKKQTYGQKLRFYVQEISNIKHIVEEYQNENSRLKIQNSQFFEHNQILKISFQKLQLKYEQVVQNEQRLLQQLQGMKRDLDQITQQINRRQLQLEANQITTNNLRKELDTERNVSKKKSDKIAAYQELNQKYLYQIKNLRIKLSEFETNVNQKQLLTQKCQKNTKTIEELEQQLKVLQDQYNSVINTYTYRKQDVEQAMKQLKQHQEKIKQQEITRVIEQLDSTHSQKQASMEQEIIELFNENSKLRLSLQQKNDDNSENLIRIAELENLPQKIKFLQRERDNFQRTVYELSQQLKTASQQLRRVQQKLNESIRNQEGKSTQNVILSKRYEDLDKKYKDLFDSHGELKKEEKRLIDKIKQITEEKDKHLQKLNSDVHHYQNKILSYELEVSRLKQNQSSSSKDYLKKIKKLQEKIQQMGDTFKQHEETLQGHYLSEIKKLEQSLQKLSEQLEQKMQRIQQLNEALIMLQQQNDDLVAELTNTRTQLAQESQIYTNDVNTLRNQLREAEQMYDANIKTLEEEMSALSKQLTVLRYNRQSGSRLSGSGVDDKSNKRFEEKVRLRDKKIEQLKNQILMMEQSITKLMRKQSTTQNVSQAEIQKLRANLGNAESEFEGLMKKYQFDTNCLSENIKVLKKQIMEWKNRNQEKELTLQEKQLEMQSMKVQLQTTKQLYGQLQLQLQKRKTYLNNQMEEQSQLQAEIRLKNLKINELTQKLDEAIHQKNKIDTELKRKSLDFKRLSQKLNQVQINFRQVFNNQDKKNSQIKAAKLKINELQGSFDKLQTQNKKLKNQMALWQKQNHQLREELEYNATQLAQLSKKIDQMNKGLSNSQSLAKKYTEIDALIQKQLRISLEQFANTDFWNNKLNQKDNDIQTLAQELQQLRFLFDHKNLELDELKKIHYQLQMKTQDNEFVYKQLQNLRKLCDKLQNDKKDAVFREQALKIQLQNLIESENRSNITEKLQNLLQGYYEV